MPKILTNADALRLAATNKARYANGSPIRKHEPAPAPEVLAPVQAAPVDLQPLIEQFQGLREMVATGFSADRRFALDVPATPTKPAHKKIYLFDVTLWNPDGHVKQFRVTETEES